jgi:hypothetical protein
VWLKSEISHETTTVKSEINMREMGVVNEFTDIKCAMEKFPFFCFAVPLECLSCEIDKL